jgi:hypothetical protein
MKNPIDRDAVKQRLLTEINEESGQTAYQLEGIFKPRLHQATAKALLNDLLHEKSITKQSGGLDGKTYTYYPVEQNQIVENIFTEKKSLESLEPEVIYYPAPPTRQPPPAEDAEIRAMRDCLDCLASLEQSACARVLEYLWSRRITPYTNDARLGAP